MFWAKIIFYTLQELYAHYPTNAYQSGLVQKWTQANPT